MFKILAIAICIMMMSQAEGRSRYYNKRSDAVFPCKPDSCLPHDDGSQNCDAPTLMTGSDCNKCPGCPGYQGDFNPEDSGDFDPNTLLDFGDMEMSFGKRQLSNLYKLISILSRNEKK